MKRQKIKRGASQTYDTPSFYVVFTLSDKFRPYICKLFVFKRVLTLFLEFELESQGDSFYLLNVRTMMYGTEPYVPTAVLNASFTISLPL